MKANEGVIGSGGNVGRKHGVRAKVWVVGLDKVESGFWMHNSL